MRRPLHIASMIVFLALVIGVVFLATGLRPVVWLGEKAYRSSIVQEETREVAARALARLDPDAALDVFMDVETAKELHGANGFQYLPLESVTKLAALLDDADPLRAAAAARGIDALAWKHEEYSFAECVPGLTRALASSDAALRNAASHAVGALGERASSATPLLLEAFKKGEATSATVVRMNLSEKDVQELIDALPRSDSTLRKRIAWVLGNFPRHKDRFTEPLRARLSDDDPDVAIQAFFVLQRVVPRESLVPAAARFLDRERLRDTALEWFEKNLAVPGSWSALLVALKDPSKKPFVFEIIERQRGDALPMELVPELLEICRTDRQLRSRAVFKLGEMGSRARAVVPDLLALVVPGDGSTFEEHVKAAVLEIEGGSEDGR